jgi:hypothetical protein
MQLLFKFKGPLLKSKSKIYIFQFLFWIPQDSYQSFNTTSHDYHDIKVAPQKKI